MDYGTWEFENVLQAVGKVGMLAIKVAWLVNETGPWGTSSLTVKQFYIGEKRKSTASEGN